VSLEMHERLGELLRQSQKTNPRLKGWRFDLHWTDGLDIGVKNNQIGGPYSAPGYKQSISGEIYLVWEDFRFTAAKLEARVVEEFPDYLKLWEKTSYHDPDGVGIFTPASLPEVDLADAEAQAIIDRQVERPFELLSEGIHRLRQSGIRKVDARIKCFHDQRHLMNSDGFHLSYAQTPVEFYFIANDSYGKGYSEKKWPDAGDINRIIRETITVSQQLEEPCSATFSGSMTLILPPEMFETFINQFLIANLYGSLVLNRQSRFVLEDFQEHRPVIRDDLSLTINNLLPYRGSSYICTAEGVPGGTIVLIDGGKLQSPILNLKYAKKAGMNPTPVPPGGSGFFITGRNPFPQWEDVLNTIDRGLIIYSVLGMHTQDASSGHFSLTADQCLYVENGKIRGKTKAVINGDFILALNHRESQLFTVEGEDNPGFVFTANAIST